MQEESADIDPASWPRRSSVGLHAQLCDSEQNLDKERDGEPPKSFWLPCGQVRFRQYHRLLRNGPRLIMDAKYLPLFPIPTCEEAI